MASTWPIWLRLLPSSVSMRRERAAMRSFVSSKRSHTCLSYPSRVFPNSVEIVSLVDASVDLAAFPMASSIRPSDSARSTSIADLVVAPLCSSALLIDSLLSGLRFLSVGWAVLLELAMVEVWLRSRKGGR